MSREKAFSSALRFTVGSMLAFGFAACDLTDEADHTPITLAPREAPKKLEFVTYIKRD